MADPDLVWAVLRANRRMRHRRERHRIRYDDWDQAAATAWRWSQGYSRRSSGCWRSWPGMTLNEIQVVCGCKPSGRFPLARWPARV